MIKGDKMNIEEFLTLAAEKEASDLFIIAGLPLTMKTNGVMHRLYVDQKEEWIKKTVINTAKSGYFSSDRTIEQYNEKIWNLKPVK